MLRLLFVTVLAFSWVHAADAMTGLDFSPDAEVVSELSNEHREVVANAEDLSLDGTLSEIARNFAQDMKDRGYFSHRSPEGETMTSRLREGGAVYRAAGENIARGQKSPEVVMRAWMNSPGHRANIMNARYRRIGVGRAGDHWVMLLTD